MVQKSSSSADTPNAQLAVGIELARLEVDTSVGLEENKDVVTGS